MSRFGNDDASGCFRGHRMFVHCYLLSLTLVMLSCDAVAQTQATIFAYPLPSIYTNSSCYALRVNGTNIPVVNYTPQYDYAEFSMSNAIANVQVTASVQSGISSYNISPEKLGITGTINRNTLSFTITNSQYLIISINSLKPFALCADSMETNAPASSGTGIFNVLSSPYNADNTGSTLTSAAIQSAINAAGAYGNSHGQGIVYVPAGVYLCGNLVLTNNTALYLAGGSVIRCTGNPADYTAGGNRGSYDGVTTNGTKFVSATSRTNLKIYGRGTVDGDGNYMGLTFGFGESLLVPINCTNLTADGVTFRDSGGWALVPTQSTNVLLTNLKIFDNTVSGQDDCVDVVDSRSVTVSNVIGIAGDDTLSTKSYSYTITNVLFENCLLWSAAIACKIGWEVYTPQDNITFSNIVVYNCMNGVGLAASKGGNSGGSPVENLTFENIDVQSNTLGSSVQQAWGVFQWEITNGFATNVLVSNINVRQTGLNGFIGGIYSNAIIDGITFSNIFMPGNNTPASNLFQMDIFNQQFYTNLSILPAQSPLPAVYLTANDPDGSTSFNQAGNWSNNQSPTSSSNYVVGAFTLRTPTSSSSTFAGGSLSLYDSATLALKNDNKTTTVGASSARGLFLDNSTVKNVDGASDTFAGYVTLLPDGGIFRNAGGTGYTFTVSAVIEGPGGLQANVSGESGLVKLTAVDTYTGNTIINAGTLALSGSASISDSATIVLAGGATFDVSGLSSTFKLASGQTLSNSAPMAVLGGSINTGSGTVSLTYTPGTPSFMVTNGTLTLSSNTVFCVNNTGAALSQGKYALISDATAGTQGAVTGTLPLVTVSGGGIAPDATASLEIQINALNLVVAPPPAISRAAVNGAMLTLMATNGPAGQPYVLLESTNLTLPIGQWKPVLTNSFDSNGNLRLNTNVINLSTPQEFYILQMQ